MERTIFTGTCFRYDSTLVGVLLCLCPPVEVSAAQHVVQLRWRHATLNSDSAVNCKKPSRKVPQKAKKHNVAPQHCIRPLPMPHPSPPYTFVTATCVFSAHPQPQRPGVRLPHAPDRRRGLLPAPAALHPVALPAGAAGPNRLDARDRPTHRSAVAKGLGGGTIRGQNAQYFAFWVNRNTFE